MSTVTSSRPAPRTSPTPARAGRPTSLTSTIDPIRVLRRHALGIVAAAIIGGILGFAAYMVLNQVYPLYEERVLFEVQPALQQAGQVGVVDQSDDNMIFRIAQTETFLLTHRVVLDRALRNPDVKLTTWYKQFRIEGREEYNINEALDELLEDLSPSVVRGSNLFSLSWATHRKEDVPIVLNAIAQAYLDTRKERDRDVYNGNLRLFEQQLESTQTTLDDLAQEMQDLIREAGITTLDDVRYSGQAIKIQELNKQLAEYIGFLSLASTNLELTAAKVEGRMEPSAADVMDAERDPSIMEQMSNIQAYKAELRRLYATRLHDDPMVVSMQARVEASEAEKDAKIKDLIRRNLETKMRVYADEIKKSQKALVSVEEEIVKTEKLLKDLAAKQDQYESLRMRREHLEARRTADLELINEVKLIVLRADAARVRQLQRALEPRETSFPKIQIMVPLGILALMGLTVGIVFLRELMDQRVKSVSDLAVLPGAQVLGGIPDLVDDPTKTTAAELVVRKHPMSVLAESYRQAATSLLPLMDRNGHQTLLMVGGLPGSGTTTMVTNIAAAAAASGKNVLVVDANFRRPRLADAMGLVNDGPGLADLLTGTAIIDQAIQDAGDGVSVIGAGSPANRVFERLANGTFESLIAELRGRFDLIIFDAPPAVVAGDAMMLANKVDAAVLVVRAHQEHRGLVARMIHRLSEARCELLGVMLNRPRGVAGGYLKKNYATMAGYGAKG